MADQQTNAGRLGISRIFPVKNMTFERSALGLVGVFVAALVTAAALNPPTGGTASPRATLKGAEPLLLTSGLTPTSRAVEVSALPQLEADLDIDVAAGPVRTARGLSESFGKIGYSLDGVIESNADVPRVFLASLPEDLSKVPENAERKAIFFQSMLPLVLQVNEEILAERRRLWQLNFNARLGRKMAAADKLWLQVMAERYGVSPDNIGKLIKRVDIVPPSLALAQAAEESGWGTSRFSREGNAIFGQWTYVAAEGLVPANRDDGKTHRIKAFENLIDSVRAYMKNLNTHRAYREFRASRTMMRRFGAPMDGRVLATRLNRYSERGAAYVTAIHGLIEANELSRLDDARLDETRTFTLNEPVI